MKTTGKDPMYTIAPSEKINISQIVMGLNSGSNDFYRKSKHKSNTFEIENSLSAWHTVSDSDGIARAHFCVYGPDYLTRTCRYTIVSSTKINKEMLVAIKQYLFTRFNIDKIICDVNYDRSDLIKDLISIGGSIEVRKRQHSYVNGVYLHVVEIAMFRGNNE